MFSASYNNTIIKINIKNDYLNIGKAKFSGDTEEARKQIQAFCDKNTVSYESFGYGYGELTVNSTKHSINPYGIDIGMMLGFCGITLAAQDKAEQKAEMPGKTFG